MAHTLEVIHLFSSFTARFRLPGEGGQSHTGIRALRHYNDEGISQKVANAAVGIVRRVSNMLAALLG
jgi:hypothetical protein